MLIANCVACLLLATMAQATSSQPVTTKGPQKTALAAADSPGVLHVPRITGVSPPFGPGGTQVRVTGKDLGWTNGLFFGRFQVPFQVQPDGSLLASAPYGSAGTTVPVTATDIFLEQTQPGSGTYAFSAGEMDVSGPLPYAGNDFDSDWYNGRGHAFYFGALPSSMVFSSPTPSFHLLGTFYDTGEAPVYAPAPMPHDVGNRGGFSAVVQYCDINQVPSNPGQACNNWDGNVGSWADAPGAARAGMNIDTAGPGKTAEADLSLVAEGLFDQANLARTLRISSSLRQLDTHTAEAGRRFDSFDTKAFNVAIAPSAVLQIDVLPYTILYHPPGNQSTASYSLASTYGTSFKLGNSNMTSNKWSDARSSDVKFAVKLGLKDGEQGASAGGGSGTSLDQTVSSGFAVTDDTESTGAASVGIQSAWSTSAAPALAAPGNGDTCGSPTDCSTVKHHADAYWHAPFWQDEFVLLVHPQFATWVLGDGIDRHVMLGAVPVTANITVGELAACATGVPLFGQNACVVQYSDNSIQTADGRAFVYVGDKHDLTISRRDAASLLALDPFYSHGQGAALPTDRALPIQKVSYGSKIGQPTSLAFDLSVDNTKAQTSTSSATAAHSATITTVLGNSSSIGLSIATELVGEELTIDNKEQSTLEEAVSVSYTDSTATSTQVVTSAKVRLNDVDNTQLLDHGDTCKPCHDPLPDAPSVTVYLDRIFGTFMYQDPGAPGAVGCRDGCNEVFVGGVLGALVGFYQTRHVFIDVQDNGMRQAAVGILDRFQIMRGGGDGTFRPDSPLTRDELMSALQRALHLSAGQLPVVRNDPVEGTCGLGEAIEHLLHRLFKRGTDVDGDDPVSRQAFADTLGHVFSHSLNRKVGNPGSPAMPIRPDGDIAPWAVDNVTRIVAAGYLDPAADGSFRAHAAITRGEAAIALMMALRDLSLSD